MGDPNVHQMQWLMDTNGTVRNTASALDADLIFTEALINANSRWSAMPDGTKYSTIATNILTYMKTGFINNNIPFCMNPWGSGSSETLKSCGTYEGDNSTIRVDIAYLNTQALNKICAFDSSYCPAYASSRQILIGALQNQGIMTRYYLMNNTYGYSDEEGWVQEDEIIKDLGTDTYQESWNAVEPYYNISRSHFMSDHSICQDFVLGSGCDSKSYDATPISVYAIYLEVAITHGDRTFANELIKEMQLKIQSCQDYPLAGPDNFANMIVLESFGYARQNGCAVG